MLMARASAKKRTTKQKSSKAAGPAKKVKLKKISPAPRSKAAKVEQSSAKAMPKGVRAVKKTPSRAPKRVIHKESMKIEAESGKHAVKTGAPSAPAVPPHLLRHTKTTSAALALLEKGIELIFKKETKKARNELKTLVETYPGELDILARARSYIQICEREEAAQKKQSIPADQLYALGVMEHNKANYDMAVSYFLQALEKHPDADYIYYSVAASQALKGDLIGSIENLRKAVELNEDSRVYAKNDADFSALQTKKEFAELIGMPPAPNTDLQ
jgi:tetratricopeptide (TPR) repeat protein